MYDLCMFIRYLVSITQVRKDTEFGLDNWCDCGNYLYIYYLCILAIQSHKCECTYFCKTDK
jgi:hypothetical protein